MNQIGYYQDAQQQQATSQAVEALRQIFESDNIAELLDADELTRIGSRVVEEHAIDEATSIDWRQANKSYLDLAKQVMTSKTTPWDNAANIKLPLLADAAIKFQARAYAEIVKDNKVVKTKIPGDDVKDEAGFNAKAQRGERVSEYMSYQLLEEIQEWEPDTDKLLLMIAVIGHVFRKTFYDPSYGRIRSYLLTPDTLFVNNSASSLATARRVTECVDLHSTDLKAMQNAGAYLDVEIPNDTKDGEPVEEQYYTILEQHRWLDLDDDGIDEPYIVTVHKGSGKVLGIKARYNERSFKLNKSKTKIIRIEAKSSYVDYLFIPSFDGGYLGTGLGALLYPLNEACNTIFNQLLDAGTLSNLQSGFISKSVKIKGGVTRFAPGEWKKTDSMSADLRNGVLPLPVREPSPTLFNLLGLILDLTKDIASIKDVLSGESPGANIPATTVAMLVEQGLKTYSAIYKRIYRSLKAEYKLLYNLNYEYLDNEEYFKVLDDTKVAYREDFEYQDCDVVPIADPALSSDVQRMAQGQALLGAIELPGVNPRPIIMQYLESIKAKNIEEILPEPDPEAVPPEVQQMQMEMELKQADMQIRERELEAKESDIALRSETDNAKIEIAREELALKSRELDYKADKYLADAMKSIADAESKESGSQISAYKAILDTTHRETERNDRQRELSGVGKPPGDGGS
jgi:chaperonin GroES